ncbi:hypothetical protein [Zhihengliuella sp.]|uniref:hypothetical protein n=1 Tax=Zhihengliuella sp. TaxID=1954483 RepID=UPI002811DD05|nr:hypothetical protein [Zhihengliuella sp.]
MSGPNYLERRLASMFPTLNVRSWYEAAALAGEGAQCLGIEGEGFKLVLFQVADDDFRLEVYTSAGTWVSGENSQMWALWRSGHLHDRLVDAIARLLDEAAFTGWSPNHDYVVDSRPIGFVFEYSPE